VGGGNLPVAVHPPFTGSATFRYRIEISVDGNVFTPLVDKSNNTILRYTEFDEFPPTQGRFVRLTFTDWPRTADQPLGVMSFTVFGRYIEPRR
jgi:hypothetical protein